MVSATTQRNLYRILPFGVIWWVFGLVFSSVELGFLGNSPITPSTGNAYNAPLSFIIACTISPAYGLIIGSVEIFFLSKFFKNKGLAKKILFKTGTYIAVFLVFTFIASPIIFMSEFDTHVLDARVWNETFFMFKTFSLWSGWIYAMLILAVCLFYAEISDNIGHGVLNNFLTGKYHSPVEEERIFMFLDMKSSTTIAEELGHLKYFELLKSYYSDFSEAIIKTSGEVYQYVGDEVVISWKTHKGLKNNNCIQCFNLMKNALLNNADSYQSNYGVVPSFKAGMHIGLVTTGEIGELKKEIIFTGDVLNTTARIQSLCNDYAVDLLVSEQLVNLLNLDTRHQIVSLGTKELKGRSQEVNLFSITVN